MSLIDTAIDFLELGFSVIPIADLELKKPPEGISWARWQRKPMTPAEVRSYFDGSYGSGIAVICGSVSDHLLLLDFDNGGELYDAWTNLVLARDHEALDYVVIEKSRSGGFHVWFRCDSPVDGNQKLAQRVTESGDTICLIETRGEGGYCAVAPTEGYKILRGDFSRLDVISDERVNVLLECARELDEVEHIERERVSAVVDSSLTRPGDVWNREGDIEGLLVKHGWTLYRDGINQSWTRPGKETGCSATLKDRVFYPFSSNCGLTPHKAYNPFALYTALEHNGDYTRAGKALRSQGLGENPVSDEFEVCDTPNIIPINRIVYDDQIRMRPEVIPGYLRQGEVMNIVAAPKTGKSWLIMQLMIALAEGGSWLGVRCPKKRVLLIDNELHTETLKCRFEAVLRGLDKDICPEMDMMCLRGQGVDLNALKQLLADVKYDLIVLDAMYRFLPEGVSESDNAQMMNLYNILDRICIETGASIALVHHTSKGSQHEKGITDIGSGAGSQTRACDTHVVLLPEEDDKEVVKLMAVTRSFAAPEDKYLRFKDCHWVPIQKPEIKEKRAYTAEDLALHIKLIGGKIGKAELERQFCAGNHGMSGKDFKLLVNEAIERSVIHFDNNVYSNS